MIKSKPLAAVVAVVTVAALLHPSAHGSPVPVTSTPTTSDPIVLHVAGTGPTATVVFTTGPDWSIGHTFNCPNAAPGFRVLEWGAGENGVPLVDRVGSGGIGTTYAFASPGAHRLQVGTACQWTVTVTNGDSMPHAGQVTPTAWGAA